MKSPPASDRRRKRRKSTAQDLALNVAAITWMPALWLGIKYGYGVSDRYLPDPVAVIEAFGILGFSLFQHLAVSVSRLLFGYLTGSIFGILAGVVFYKYNMLEKVFLPGFHAVRAIPATATLPFFILWFGFAELGKILIIVMGISLNLTISTLQILYNMPEKYKIAFSGFGFERSKLPIKILLLFACESLLPTLRFSLTVAVALAVVAEYLGAQSGLGYVIQSARTTYSLDVIVLCAALFGIIAWAMDAALCGAWRSLIPWKQQR